MEVLRSCWVVATSALPAGIAFSNALAATHRLCISAEKDYFEGPDAAVQLSVRGSTPPDPGDRRDLSNTFGQLSYPNLTPSRFLLLLSRIGERDSDGNMGAVMRGLDITPLQILGKRAARRAIQVRRARRGCRKNARRPAWWAARSLLRNRALALFRRGAPEHVVRPAIAGFRKPAQYRSFDDLT